MPFRGSNAGIETSASLVNAITDNALFHSSSHINQMLPQIVHILHFFSVRHVAPDSVVNWITLRLLSGHKSGSIWVTKNHLRLLHFRSAGSE